ncbi:MAG: hypothetical protein NTV10_05075 [Methanoregula sp.]|jgi:hypothetical protein|nr:hypothetical protein [Methanoregula sp.]
MKQQIINRKADAGVANLIEYVMISGILMFLMVVMMLLVNTNIMEGPADQVSSSAFTDIGNGISARIVDVYVTAPYNGTISTFIDLPDDVAGKDYFVEIGQGIKPTDQDVTVSRDYIYSKVSLAGIGATRGVMGNTTGRGMNKISYDSGGF